MKPLADCETKPGLASTMSAARARPLGGQYRRFLWAAGGLILAFSLPLFSLGRFAVGSDLYSHIVLIPLASLYFVWIRRRDLPARVTPSPLAALPLALVGGATLALWWFGPGAGSEWKTEDSHALTTAAFLLFLTGALCLFLGTGMLRAIAFPWAFLVFMIPLPEVVLMQVEAFLQHGSAPVAAFLLRLSGMPVLEEGLVLSLPNFRMQVAPECSGIHSSLVLFITSLAAGELFLRSRWKRAFLSVVVVPLALLRNGFRIFVIGQLCVRIGPEMIHSYIHRQGGPIFFALSLIPFALLLFLLWKSEHRRKGVPRRVPAPAMGTTTV